MKTLRSLSMVIAMAAGTTLAGCDADEILGPDREEVAGTYTATQFSITTGSGSEDLLDLGGSVTLTLDADGTSTGTFASPAIGGDPAFVADLEGTWDITIGGFIQLEHDDDTVLRDVLFEYDNGELVASEVFTSGVVDIVLRRNAP